MRQSVWERAIDLLGLGADDDYEDEVAMRSEAVHDEDEGVYHLHPERPMTTTVPLVRAEPRNMDDAAVVADEMKRQVPLILNLAGATPEEARRIRDFLAGVAYGLNGYMKRMGEKVYACSPFDMPIEKLSLDGSKLGESRYVRDDDDEDRY